MSGWVALIGAGPGAADLIARRGLELLRQADVVVYDRLIPVSLLAEAPAEAERICAAKTDGRHRLPQRELEALLIERARAGRRVVRLKGGDPYVYGRGGEEALALAEAGIPCELVPGLSSALAAPAAAGIPLTHRGLAHTVHIHTGQRGAAVVAGDGETHVVLMGLGALPEVAARLQAAGVAPQTPAAMVQCGAGDRQRVVRAPLAELPEAVAAAGLLSPALLVVGQTVALAERLPRQLGGRIVAGGRGGPAGEAAGLRIAVAGGEGGSRDLVAALAAAGAEVVPVALWSWRPDPKSLRAAPELSLEAGDGGLGFGSAKAVELWWSAWIDGGLDLRRLRARLCAADADAAAALASRGLRADIVGPQAAAAAALWFAIGESPPHPPGVRVVRLALQIGLPGALGLLSDLIEEEMIDGVLWSEPEASSWLSRLQRVLGRGRCFLGCSGPAAAAPGSSGLDGRAQDPAVLLAQLVRHAAARRSATGDDRDGGRPAPGADEAPQARSVRPVPTQRDAKVLISEEVAK